MSCSKEGIFQVLQQKVIEHTACPLSTPNF